MKIALDLFITLLVLVAGFWIALFGSTGVVLASRARFTKIQGFFVGSLLGPCGLIWLLIRGRRDPRELLNRESQLGSQSGIQVGDENTTSGNVDLDI